MAIFIVTTSDFTAQVNSPTPPMVPNPDFSRNSPAYWGGEANSPAIVNEAGEFLTRAEVEAIHGSQPYYDLMAGGYRTLTSFAEVGAEASEDLEIYGNDSDHDTLYVVEFIPHAEEDRAFTNISSEDNVIEIHERDFMGRTCRILVPNKEIPAMDTYDGTSVAYVSFKNSTYKALIHQRDL